MTQRLCQACMDGVRFCFRPKLHDKTGEHRNLDAPSLGTFGPCEVTRLIQISCTNILLRKGSGHAQQRLRRCIGGLQNQSGGHDFLEAMSGPTAQQEARSRRQLVVRLSGCILGDPDVELCAACRGH